ncbi:BrnA antitoxin family protein [Sphingomonas sp. YL-JM2C]
MSKRDTKTSWVDPDEAPELTEEWFAKARLMEGEKIVRRGGRPRGSNKDQVTLRIDHDALERFKAGGPGWQSRINDALRKAVGL